MSTTCLYASKPCANPRSTKDNGQLHRLCTLHRLKANDAQRRWHMRQRSTSPTASSDAESDASTQSIAQAPKPTAAKRRRTTETTKAPNDEPKRRRRINPSKLAQPRAWSMPLAAPLAAPLLMPFTDVLTATSPVETNIMNDQELVQLGEFIVELEQSKLYTSFGAADVSSGIAFEKEWWLSHEPSTDVTVVCL